MLKYWIMEQTAKSELFFISRFDAIATFRQLKFESPLYNLVRFTYFNGNEELRYYLTTSVPFISVVCEISAYLSMLAGYSHGELGYEPVEKGFTLVSVELVDM